MEANDMAILLNRQLHLTEGARAAAQRLMDMRSPLEQLTVEIKAMILGLLDSPEDLLFAIRSCRALYKGYKASEKQIVRSVLFNAVGNASMQDMLGLVNLPRFEPGDSQVGQQVAGGNLVSIFWAKIGGHAERHFDQANPWAVPTALGEVRRLCGMSRLIDAYVAEYLEFFRSMAKHRTPLLCRPYSHRWPDNSPPTIPRVAHVVRGEAAIRREASEGETVRLRRGFIRYQMLCGMTSIPHWAILADYCAMNEEVPESVLDFDDFTAASVNRYQVQDFFGQLSVAECEEVLAVAEYVHCQYRKMIGEARRSLDTMIETNEQEPTGPLLPNHHTALWYATHGQRYSPRDGRWTYNPQWRYLCQPEASLHHTDFRWIAPGLGLCFLLNALRRHKASRIALMRTAAGAFAPDRDVGFEHIRHQAQAQGQPTYSDLALHFVHTSASPINFDQHSNGVAPTAAAHPGLVAALDVMWHNVHGQAYSTPGNVTTRLRLGCVFWDADRIYAVKPTRAGRTMSLAGPSVTFGDEGEWSTAECVVDMAQWQARIEPAFAAEQYRDDQHAMDPSRQLELESLMDWVHDYGI
ncbi:hypothetical protein B0T25DRAFT_608192 [Lasiosphaeria hispida]|uniref:Uncharacterized protein n=1 Tax=Lasiosphaeria hispida TaxID=260671 RepID=A0AAJ0HJA7_9PEZI|nr:hypothetical protein B0T25DRAFT_608192 [Lasiosphaeria hispida]